MTASVNLLVNKINGKVLTELNEMLTELLFRGRAAVLKAEKL